MNGSGHPGARDRRGLLARLFPDATRGVLVVVVAVSALGFFYPDEILGALAKDNDAIRAGEVWRLLTAGLVARGNRAAIRESNGPKRCVDDDFTLWHLSDRRQRCFRGCARPGGWGRAGHRRRRFRRWLR